MNSKIFVAIILAGTVSLAQAQKKSVVKKANTTNAAYKNLSGNAVVTIDVTQLQDKNGRFFLRSSHINDSATVKNGKLVFKSSLTEPEVAYLMYYPQSVLKEDLSKLRVQRKNLFPFYMTVGNTNIVVKDSVQVAKVINPNLYQTEYNKIESKQRSFEMTQMLPLVKEFYASLGKNDQATAKKLSDKLDTLSNFEKESIFKPFIVEKATTSPVSLAILAQYAGNGTDGSKVDDLFKKLNKEYQELPTGISIKEGIEQQLVKTQKEKATQIGQQALDFTQNDTAGHPVSLKDFRGRYVLVDFWASWCGPCRGENPNVVAAFQKYHNKNFTVLGVSFDQNKDNWLAAIHKDGLAWTQVSDLQYWNNAVGKIYGIESIPANILVDPNGKIIARNIRGEVLQGTLENIFKQ